MGTLHADALMTRLGGEGRLERQSVEERRSQLAEAGTLLREHPVAGVGPGQMPAVLAARDAIARSGWEYQPVHNVMLLVAVELGAVGLLLWLVIVWSALFSARRQHHDAESYRGAFTAMFVGLLVMGMFDHYLWSLWIGQLLFWMCIGMLHTSEK